MLTLKFYFSAIFGIERSQIVSETNFAYLFLRHQINALQPIQSCLFPVTEPAPALLCVLLFLLVFLASEGDVSQLVLDELLLGRHPLRQRDEERLHLLPVAVDLFLLALREMHPPVRE